MQFHQTVLDNGLHVVAELNDQARSVASGFFVKTGSRDESHELAGGSHFLEHIVFKGTPPRDAPPPADVGTRRPPPPPRPPAAPPPPRGGGHKPPPKAGGERHLLSRHLP